MPLLAFIKKKQKASGWTYEVGSSHAVNALVQLEMPEASFGLQDKNDEVPGTDPDDHSQKQAAVVGHYNQHQEVAEHNFQQEHRRNEKNGDGLQRIGIRDVVMQQRREGHSHSSQEPEGDGEKVCEVWVCSPSLK